MSRPDRVGSVFPRCPSVVVVGRFDRVRPPVSSRGPAPSAALDPLPELVAFCRGEEFVTMLKKNFLHWVACAIAVACWLSPRALYAQQGAAVLTGNVVDASTKEPLA